MAHLHSAGWSSGDWHRPIINLLCHWCPLGFFLLPFFFFLFSADTAKKHGSETKTPHTMHAPTNNHLHSAGWRSDNWHRPIINLPFHWCPLGFFLLFLYRFLKFYIFFPFFISFLIFILFIFNSFIDFIFLKFYSFFF